MNKIFKVVWSKTKECYVVVSEVAKNNSGKKKILASVLAGLAMIGAGTGQTYAANYTAGGGASGADASISIGGGYSGPNTRADSDFSIAIGDNAHSVGKASIAQGYKAETQGTYSVAIGNMTKAKNNQATAVGSGATATGEWASAFGYEASSNAYYGTAIGSGAKGNGSESQAIGREAETTGTRAVAVGTLAKALNDRAIAIGEYTKADGTNSIAMGKSSKAHSFDAIAIGHNNNSRTYSAISIGTDNTSDVAYGLTDAQFDALKYDENNINDPSKTDPRRGVSSTIAIGRNNLAGNVEAIAIGTETKATKTDAIAIGARAEATGDYALAIGGASGGKKISVAEYGTAVGALTNAAQRAAALGAGANAVSQKSVAIGYKATTNAQKATSNYEFSGSHGVPSPAGYTTETITVNSAPVPTGGAVAGNYYDAGSAIAIGNSATVSDESDQAVVVGADAKTIGNAHYSVVLGSGSRAEASDGFVGGHGSYVKARESIAIGAGANVEGNENIRSQAIGFGATVTGTGAYDATAIGATAQVNGVQGGVALGAGSEVTRKTSDNENVGFNSKFVNGTKVRNRAYEATIDAYGNQWDVGGQTGAVSVGNDVQKRQIINVAAGNKDTDAVNVAQLKNVGVRVGADTNTATIGANKVAADFLAYNGQLNIKGDSNRVTTVSENDANGKDANVNVKFDYDGLVKAKAGSSVTVNQKTEGGKTVFEIDAAAGGTASTESVVKKVAVTGDTNIADVSVAGGKNVNDPGAQYEVSVSKNAVKDAAREAVTVNNGGTTKADGSYTADSNNPISVTPTQDNTNHNTTYAVTFDGNKAAKQIPLTYKANGNGAKTVTLDKGLDFTNGTNTTAEIGNDGVVKFNLNDKVTLTDAGSVTIGDTKVNNDGLTITGGPSITKTGGINAGNQKVTNVAPGTISSTSTDAVNGSQLYDVDQKFNNTVKLTGNAGATDGQALNKTGGLSFGVVGANSGKYISTTANGSDVTVDLSTDAKKLLNNTVEVKGKNAATVTTSTETTADGGTKTIYTVDVANTGTVAKSSWNIKSSADTANGGATATGHEVAAKNIADTNNVEMVAGKNLIVKQTSDANGATVEFALAKDLKDLDSVTTGKTITKEITLKDPSGTGETVIKRDGDRITYNTNGSTTVNKVANLADEKHITATTAGNEYTVDADGNVTMTYTDGNGDLVTGEKAVIKGVAKNNLSNIDNDGKKVITGLGSVVKAGDNVVVKTETDATTGQKTYTVNAVTPAVYTTPDGEKLTKDQDGKFHKVGETAEYTGDVITSFENPKAAAGQTTKDGGMIVNNVGSAIKNQTPTMPAGQTATYLDKLKAAADAGSNVKNAAVNVSDLHNTAEALRANELHIAPTAVKAGSTEVKGGALNAAGTENVYKYDAATKKVTLTYNDGNGKAVSDTKAVIDFSALNTGGTTTSTWTAKTSAENTTAGSEVGKHVGDTSQVIDNQNSVDFQAGRNMTVKQTNDGNGNTTINYALDKDLTNLDKVVVNGKDGQAGKDGVTIVGPQGATGAPGVPGTNGIDGKVGITGKDGKDAVSIAGKDGVGTIGLTGPQGPAGADGKGVDISTDHGTQTLVKPEANNGNKSERIVYVPKDKDGNPLNDTDGNPIKREVATMDDGLKFAGDDGQTNANKVIAKQLNQQVDIIGGATGDLSDNNIGVNNDNGKLKVQLAKDVNLTPTGSLTTGDTKVNNDGITIKAPTPAAGATPTTDVKLTNTGLDNGGNKITNVKAGENDTDAVNVKQLKANRTEVKAGDNVVVTSDVDATDNHTVYTVNAVTPAVYTTPDGEKLTKDKDGKFHKVGETAEYTGDVITSFENPKAAAGQTTKDGGMIVNNVGSAIKNQTPTMPAGQTATYLDKLKAAADAGSNVKNAAVNVSDLHNTAEALKATELHIAPTVGGNDADKGGVASGNTNPGAEAQAYKYNATTKQVELTFNDGNGKAVTGPKAVIDFSDLDIPAATTPYSFKANALAGDGKLDGTATATAVENGGTVNFEAGKNLTVKQTVNAAAKTQTYTYSLDKDLTNLDKVVVNGKDGQAGKDGVTIVGPQGATGAPGVPGTNGIDGKVGITGKDGKDAVSIAGKDGVGTIGLTGPQGPAGADGKGVDISTDHGTQTLVKPEANNGNKSERIVYVPKDKDGNPLNDTDGNPIKREVATMDDGLKFAGDDGQTNANKVIAKQLNQQVDIIGGATGDLSDNNIGVNNDNGKLKVQLAKDVNLTPTGSLTTGDTKVNNDGITIKAPTPAAGATPTTDVKLTNTGLDNGGNKITNVKAGENDTDAVNVKQLKANRTEVKAGDNVVVTSDVDATDNHTVYTVNAVTPAVYTTPDGEKLTKDKDGKFHKVGETAEYTGDVITSFENPKAAAGQTTKDGGMIVNNVGSAIKNQTPTMPAGQTATYLDKLKAAADAGSNVKNAAVNVSDLHNTAEALKATELHIAPTVGGNDADKGGVASGNTNPGAEAQAYKYNATTKQVELTFNDGNGKAVTGPKAVIDFSDLDIPAATTPYSFKANALAGDGKLDGTATATAVENGGTVNFEAGKNLTVKQTVNAAAKTQTYTYSLDKDLTNLDKVVVNGKDGQAGKDGVTIVGPQGATGTPGTNGIDGKVGITGKDGKDAVSIAGKDGVGTIGLTGPQGPAGADGKGVDISTDHGTQTLVKPEANNGNKSERIVYVPKDKDGNPLNDTDGNPIKREVATMDDGLKFAGDDGQTNANKVIAKQLNQQVDIIGGATGTLTDNNIGVNNDGNGKLKVQLAKDVNLTDTGSIKFGDTADDNTVINKGGITITKPAAGTDPAKTVSLTGDGLNNGGNKITNVKAGENDTDAVNVKQLKDKVTTVESSNNSIKVVDKNAPTSATYDAAKGHQYDITINNQSVVENAQTPVVYTDKDGNKLYLVDGKFYKTPTPTPTDQEVPATDVIASMNNGGNSTTDPMKLNNVGSSIVDHATPGVTTPTFLDKLNAAANDTKTQNGAVNVTDLKSTADDLIDKGLKFTANSGGVKTNKLGSTVKVLGEGAKADTEYSGENVKTIIGQDTDGNTTIDVKLDKNLKSETITVTGKDGKDGKIGINGKDGTNGVDGTNRVDIQVEKGVDGIDGKNGADGISRIVYEDKTGKHTVATMEDGLAFKGDNTTVVKKKLGEQLDIVGGATGTLTDNNIGVNEDNGKLKVQLAKDVDLTKDGSLTIGDTVVNKDGIKIANADPNKTVSLTGSGLNNGGNTITNVAAGKNDTDAVNVKQLKDNVTTVTSSDNSISVTDTNTDASKGHAYDIKVNSQGVVNKAQTPVVYTKQDGTKVYLVGDKFYDNPQGTGTEVPKSDVIASMNNADGSTTNPMKLNNVGSSIADKAGNTFLDKIDAAAGDNNTKNGAVNVTDLKNTADAIGNKGLNFGAQSGNDIHKNLGEKLEIVGEGTKADDNYSASNIKTMTKDGKVVIGLDKDLNGLNSIGVPGKDGVAGKDGVSISGKDGANGIDGKVSIGKDGKDAVSIAGKDGVGHIGLTGPQGPAGADGTGVDISTDHGSKTLVKPEANNGDKSERIVYVPKDKDGNPLKDTDGNPIKREVATMDDGLKFTGNNTSTENKHALNTLVKVQGEGVTEAQSNAFQSAAGNINVVADGNDTLTVKLNKDLKGINSIKNSDNGPALNFNAGDLSVTGGNLNMGGNKITNLGKGTNDTDAVNLKQLKDSRTIVKSTDGSVGVRESESADGAKVYDLSTGASPRFDELTDEIGRVGAQGAALAALKPIQYDPLEPTQIMAGYGNYRGNSAIAMGVAHYKNESTMMHAGLAWAGGSRHMMANAGVTWKVGNRDSEAAVADRYRKGPISSAYAMQQEMASVKAQNAGLKTEVSDLKAENEQMKAQIAAMMAKLGM